MKTNDRTPIHKSSLSSMGIHLTHCIALATKGAFENKVLLKHLNSTKIKNNGN